MPKIEQTPPNAANFIFSLRKLGYSFSSALADIIDNSIGHGEANKIFINYYPQESWLSIQDNGIGMDKKDLLNAMTLGSSSPESIRGENDLGRFGCGLKTASFSQCTRLTVISNQKNTVSAACWNLERIKQSGNWDLEILNKNEIRDLTTKYDLSIDKSGTIILWEDIDSLRGKDDQEIEDDQAAKIDESKNHLSLVFHRFIEEKLISINFNHELLKPLNPFLEGKAKTHQTPIQYFLLPSSSVNQSDKDNDQQSISFTGYTLPPMNSIKEIDQEVADLGDGLAQSQGFYIYRNKRLISFGGWFGLKKYQALTELARVKVDVPNSLDEDWATDVKKTKMVPPPSVKKMMKTYLQKLIQPSLDRQNGAGAEAINKSQHWMRAFDDGYAQYSINKDTDEYKELVSSLTKDKRLLLDKFSREVAADLPYDQLYVDIADKQIKK